MPPGSTKWRSTSRSCSARCSHPTTFMTLPKSGSGCSASSTATSRPQSPSTGSTPALTWIGYCAASMRASSSPLRHETPHGLRKRSTKLLGWVARYDNQRGDYRPAELGYRQQGDTYQRVLGPDHPDTLKSMNNLAVTLADLG